MSGEPESKPKPTRASWAISLNCDCPGCDAYVDLLEYPDFWDGRTALQIAERDTPASRGVEVVCPACGHEFEVDCDY